MSATTANAVFIGTGRRKTASARVRLTEGTGKFTINGKELDVYLPEELIAAAAAGPLTEVELREKMDVVARVQGGGPHGQAVAVSHGLARALEKFDGELRAPLKKAGYLRRDPRMRERKKTGQPGARKRFQFSKR
jgi:small subunit ribosomal protein S9